MYFRKYLLLLLLIVPCLLNAQITREKQAILDKPFPLASNGGTQNDTLGDVYDEFGDLFFEKNGKTYWLPTFTQITGPTLTYYRLFELKLDSGYAKEVTKEMLGGYYFTGGLNPPYYYEDIDNDGIKDILIFDHGKEEEIKAGKWGSYNVFFKGTNTGFVKTEIKGVTDSYQYFHAHSIGDFDNDGDIDIAYSTNKLHIFQNNGNAGFAEMKVNNYDSLDIWHGYQIYINSMPYPAGGFSVKFAKINTNNSYLSLLTNSNDQILQLDYDKSTNTWNPSLYGQSKPFTTNPNAWLGCEQVLDFFNSNTKSSDLIFRISTFDKVPYSNNNQYYAKFYKSENSKLISKLTVPSFDTSYAYYIDPKTVDINFDGKNDIVHKEYGYGNIKRTPLSQRIWLNDGKNEFTGSNIKFDSLLSSQMYLFVKSDTLKKYNLFMTVNELKINYNTTKVIYNRFDSLVYPVKSEFNIKLCEGETNKTQLIKVPIGMSVVKQAQKGKLTIADSTATYTANSVGIDTVSFKLKNDFFESGEYRIIYNNIAKPTTPTIIRDTANNLVSSSLNSKWYKDGTAISDTAQKIKPTIAGSYTVSTTQNGCSSVQSNAYYYLVTDIINLSADEFIKLAPNPFQGMLHFDFMIRGVQKLNLEVFDITTGNKLISLQDQQAGQSVDFSQLNPGTYIIRVSSRDKKIDQHFKMVKM